MIQILPAILDKTPEDFENHINQLTNSEGFKEGWVHIDFADNEFVPNQTVGVDTVAKYPTNLKKEAHLMVAHPLEWLDQLKEAGFDRVIFHFESKDDPGQCLKRIKELGMEAGVALKIETNVESLERFRDKIDLVLVMAIVPGFQGQPFLPEALDKIRKLKETGWLRISVDGAVRDSNVREIIEAGADQLSVGSFLLKGDVDENLEKIWEAIR